MRVRKTSVLIFVSCYLPGFRGGGPVQSIAGLVDGLSDEFQFFVVTSDTDRGQTECYANVRGECWKPVGQAKVLYLSKSRTTLSVILELMKKTPHDLLYLNSYLSPRFTTLPLLARMMMGGSRVPVVLAPRGEFSRGAFSLKPIKKQIFRMASKVLRLHSDVIWQASTSHEENDIRRVIGPKSKVRTAMDIPRQRVFSRPPKKIRHQHDMLRVVFLSRIAAMKNLMYALRVLENVEHSVQFTIYGPAEDVRYWARCQEIIAGLPGNIETVYRGAISPEVVLAELSLHDLFFLPTLGENYGHVIAEAVQAGLVLLLSDQTPWRGLADAGVGYDLPLECPAGFSEVIDDVAGWGDARWEDARHCLAAYAQQATDSRKAISASRTLLNDAIGITRNGV